MQFRLSLVACCVLATVSVDVAAQSGLTTLTAAGGIPSEPVSVGDYLYFPRGTTIDVWDVRNPGLPAHVGRSVGEPGAIASVAAVGNYLYAVSGGPDATATLLDHLSVYSLASPTAPSLVHREEHQPYVSDENGPLTAVVASGSYVYVLDINGGVHVYDATDPANPQFLSLVQSGDFLNIYRGDNGADTAAIFGDKLVHTGCKGGDAGYVFVYDLSAPAMPVFSGSGQISPSCNPDVAQSVLADGYAITGAAFLQVFDYRDPANIQSIDYQDQVPAVIGSIAVEGAAFFPVLRTGDLQAWDFSQPAAPALVGSGSADILDSKQDQLATTAFGPVVVNDLDFATVIDTSTLSAPAQSAQFNLSGTQEGNAAFDGTYAYLTGFRYGFQVVDPHTLAHVGRYDEVQVVDANVQMYDIAIAGHIVYLAEGLQVAAVDVSDPTAPVRLGTLALANQAIRLVVVGDRLYVAGNALSIVDVSNPASMTLLGTTTPGATAYGLQVRGDYAYLAEEGGGSGPTFLIVDVSDSAAPVPASANADCANSYGIDVSPDGNTVFVDCIDAILRVYDVTDKRAPVSLANYAVQVPQGLPTTTSVLVDTTLYVGSYIGLHAIDVSDPVHPHQAGFTPTYASVQSIAWSQVDQLIYVYSVDAGLVVLAADTIFSSGFE